MFRENVSKNSNTTHNENGSIMFIALMLLAIMTVIGVSSTNTTVVENFLVRNTTIRKQNIMMADAAAAEALQQTLDAGIIAPGITNPPLPAQDEIVPSGNPLAWVNDDETWNWNSWYDAVSGPMLNVGNSAIAEAVVKNNGTGISEILNQRGELATNPVRYAVAGWEPVVGGTLKMTTVMRGSAIVLAEYMSEDYGGVRLSVGLERDFY